MSLIKMRVYHKGDFTLDVVMLSLSKHHKEYLSGSFDRLRMTKLYL